MARDEERPSNSETSEGNRNATPIMLAVLIACCKLSAATIRDGAIPEHGRRSSPSNKKTGLVVIYTTLLVVIGCVLLRYFFLNNVAVDRSISLVRGTATTQNFFFNHSGFYRLGIRVQRKLPHRDLQCLLGINDA